MSVITFNINGHSSSSFIMYDEVFYIENNWSRLETIREPEHGSGRFPNLKRNYILSVINFCC